MSAPKDGGPAFPVGQDTMLCSVRTGMSLRDYFAAKAMQGLLASKGTIATVQAAASQAGEKPTPFLAKGAYEIADAMIAAREGEK